MFLFDTTYFLPFIRIATNIDKLKMDLQNLLRMDEIEKYLSQPTILELKWLSLREYRTKSNVEILETTNSAIQSLIYNNDFSIINPWKSSEILSFADKVRMTGHTDYVDCLILGTAKFKNVTLISEDHEFKKIIETLEWNLDLLNWQEFTSKVLK